ncbi:hypothetical protein D3C80_1138170 [compost metagenome]
MLAQKLFDFFVYSGLVTFTSWSVNSRPLGNQQLAGANNDLNSLSEQRFKVGLLHEMGCLEVGWGNTRVLD